jgi:hypothetical protein
MSKALQDKLHLFFPAEVFTEESVQEETENGDILTSKTEMLPYLQTALLDDKVIEVEIDGAPRVHFTRLKDDVPADLLELAEHLGEDEESGYAEGDYLKEMSHLVCLPIEPGMGNVNLRHSRTLVVRMFTNTYAVEFGTVFLQQGEIEDIPVLHLDFPQIARIVRNAREYRAQVPTSLEFLATVDLGDDEEITIPVANISLKGLALSLSRLEQEYFALDDTIQMKLYLNDELVAHLNGAVRHFSKVRKAGGIEHVCGVQFDLDSRTTAAVVESIVATVQRAHLKELSEKADASGLNLIA